MTPTQPNALEAPHQLQLDSRARLHMTGVIEVESFDESTIVLTTTRGTLIVRGEGLHLQLLRLDGGEVLVDGTVDALTYEGQPAGRQLSGAAVRLMELPVFFQAEQAALAALLGVLLAALYDLLRALRRVLPGAAGFADGLFALCLFPVNARFRALSGTGRVPPWLLFGDCAGRGSVFSDAQPPAAANF